MNERFFLAAWNALSSEEQEAFDVWAKATLDAENAKQKFINTYLLKEIKQIQSEDFQVDWNTNLLAKDFETFKRHLFIAFVLVSFRPCSECDNMTEPQRTICRINCLHKSLFKLDFDINFQEELTLIK